MAWARKRSSALAKCLLLHNGLGVVFIAILVWSCGMLSDAVVENLVHT